MSAFSALKAYESAVKDREFNRMRGRPASRSPIEAMESTGYSGHAGRPTHTAEGRKKIRGFNLAQRAENAEKAQLERDKFFSQAAGNRLAEKTGLLEIARAERDITKEKSSVTSDELDDGDRKVKDSERNVFSALSSYNKSSDAPARAKRKTPESDLEVKYAKRS